MDLPHISSSCVLIVFHHLWDVFWTYGWVDFWNGEDPGHRAALALVQRFGDLCRSVAVWLVGQKTP